jgi:hypothetical protein
VPTKHSRIAVVNDPPLAEAIERVRLLFGDAPAARIVHDLALEGAAALAEREAERRAALRRVAALDISEYVDMDVLARVEELAW